MSGGERIAVGLISLGCAKNRVDSELLLGLLADGGFEIVTDPKRARAILVNTCGFIEAAKRESIETLFEMGRHRETGELRVLIATGCLVQRYAGALYGEMPEVDGFIGVNDYADAPEVIRAALRGERPIRTAGPPGLLEGRRLLTTDPPTAYVKISDGCDHRCAYCAIPMIRGPYRERPLHTIVGECERLCGQGIRELALVAQDTSRYGGGGAGGPGRLPELLEALSAIRDLKWLRVLYCHPETADDAVIGAIAGIEKVCPYIDLPIQHIDGDVLRRMNRAGSPDRIRERLDRCREAGLTVRTTLIVGFPGEGEREFEALMDFARERRFHRMSAFAYSAEDGTPAAGLPDPVPEAAKAERLRALMELQRGISEGRMRERIGERREVLVEGLRRGGYYGRSTLEAPEIDGKIIVKSERAPTVGGFRFARIVGAGEYDLIGADCD